MIFEILDFGSAMKVYGEVEDTISPRFCGTVKYCPPEAIRADKFRALPGEIWAMGILVYTLSHGVNPFPDIHEIMNAPLEFDQQLVKFEL